MFRFFFHPYQNPTVLSYFFLHFSPYTAYQGTFYLNINCICSAVSSSAFWLLINRVDILTLTDFLWRIISVCCTWWGPFILFVGFQSAVPSQQCSCLSFSPAGVFVRRSASALSQWHGFFCFCLGTMDKRLWLPLRWPAYCSPVYCCNSLSYLFHFSYNTFKLAVSMDPPQRKYRDI
jgi:hypothetical protein